MPVLKERDIEQYLVKRVEAMGGEVRKVKWVNRKAAPDRLVMLPPAVGNLRRGFWVELKRPGGKPRADQLREHGRMKRMGEPVFVVSTLDQVEALLS